MLEIDRLTYRVGARVLLDAADARIDAGHRVGLVGRNGSGKTTLLRLIAGTLEAQEGTIRVPARWRIGMTSQEAPGGETSLIDTVLAADDELTSLNAAAEEERDPHRLADVHMRLQDKDAHSAPARAARLLAGLGFSDEAQRRPCASFSGGWRMRVALAGLLFQEPDLLLLDEPTNHLDLEATLWLEAYLRRYPGTVLLVSHDRDLLNRVVEEILHLEGAKLTLYTGGYDRFERTRRMRLEQDAKLRDKQEAQRRHIRAFVDRFRYKASKARQAQSRLKMLERLEPIAERTGEPPIAFAFPDPDPLPPPLLAIDNVAVGYDGTPVLRGLSLRIDGDDRIALLGANGNGKSTLIKLIAGALAPMAGEVSRARKLRVGHFAQHQTDALDLSATPVVEMARRRSRDPEVVVRSHLGRFGFSQERADTPVAALSGGEKARLLFALMTADRPHVLLLDEPTNHLDVESREALIQALNAFSGAVIIAAHDPHVIALTADRFWLVDSGRVQAFEGDLDDYRTFLLGRRGDAGSSGRDGGAQSGRGGDERKERRREAADRRAALAPLRKRLQATETKIERLEQKKSDLAARLGDPALYEGETDRLVEVQKQLGRLERDLQAAEADWLELQEAWEQAQAPAP